VIVQLHLFALLKSAKKCDCTFAVLKEATKKVNHTFEKSNRSVIAQLALLKRATKKVIARSIFGKEQQKVRLHHQTFESAKMCNLGMCDCPARQITIDLKIRLEKPILEPMKQKNVFVFVQMLFGNNSQSDLASSFIIIDRCGNRTQNLS